MNYLLAFLWIRNFLPASGTPGPSQVQPTQPASVTPNVTIQAPKNGLNEPKKQPQTGQVTAFPDSPKAPPPRVVDIAVPPAPVTPGSTTGQAYTANEPLSAEEAVRIALRQQPNLGVKVGAIQTQQGHTIQTGSAEHPQVTITAGWDSIQQLPGTVVRNNQPIEAPTQVTPPGVSPIYPYSITAAGKQLLFDFDMTRNLVRQSEALERSAKHDLTVAQQDLILAVNMGFYNYADAERLVKVNEANVENRQLQLDLALARLRNGVGEPGDVATAQTSKSQAIVQLNQARNVAEQDRVNLLQQMGVDPLTPVVVAGEFAPQPKSNDAHALTAEAIKQRPEVKSAVEALAAARYGMNAARAVDMPSIYAEIGVGYAGDSFPPTDNVANLSIGLQWPIIDGGYRRGAVKIAQGQITTAEANLKTAVLQVRTDVAGAYMSLKSAEQRVALANNEVTNAKEDVRIAVGRYKAGFGLFQDITTAQSLLVTAMTDQEGALNVLDIARTQLRRASGEMLTDAR